MRSTILKTQSNIASKPATGMEKKNTLTKNKQLTSLKAIEDGVVGACTGYIQPKDNRTCFLRNSDNTATVGMCQQNVNVNVSQTEYSIMQIKIIDYMREVNT